MNAPSRPTPSIFDRLLTFGSDTLYVLDPACLVPGTTCLLACLFPLLYQGRISAGIGWTPRAFGMALVAYAMGFVCCGLGGQVRRRLTRLLRPRAHFHVRLRKHLLGHGLATSLEPATSEGLDSPYAGYTRARHLYQRLLASLSREEATRRAIRIRRALITCYDGLAVSLALWSGVFLLVPRYVEAWPTPWNASLVIAGVLCALVFGCYSEAERHDKQLPRELVAALAAQLKPHELASSGAPTP